MQTVVKSFTIYGVMCAADPTMIHMIPTDYVTLAATGLEFNEIILLSPGDIPCKMEVHNAKEFCWYMLQFQSTPPEFSELPYEGMNHQFFNLKKTSEKDYFYGLLDYNKNFHLSHLDLASHRFEFHNNFYKAKAFLIKDNETGHSSVFGKEYIPPKVWNNEKYSILARPEVWAGFVPK